MNHIININKLNENGFDKFWNYKSS